jgi:hypothetical protein
MSLIPVIGHFYNLKQTIPKTSKTWLNGLCKVQSIVANSVPQGQDTINLQFKNGSIAIFADDCGWNNLRIESTDETEFNTNKVYNKNELYEFFNRILNTDINQSPDIRKFLDKIIQDSYSAPGNQKSLTFANYQKIKIRVCETREEIEAELNKSKRIHCGAIFNRAPRWNKNVLSKSQEEEYLRDDENFGYLPFAIRQHDSASKYECNLILLKLISFVIKLKGVPERFNITTEQINKNYNNILHQQKDILKINEDDLKYLVNHNKEQNNPYTRDFLTNTELSLDDILDQQYKNMEHKLNFCHIYPQLGTKYKNVCFGLTRPNRLQGDLTMKQLFILYLYGDTDERRLELMLLILTNNHELASILNSNEEISLKITNLTTYLDNQYY